MSEPDDEWGDGDYSACGARAAQAYPAEMTVALRDVLGMAPGPAIIWANALRRAGFSFKRRYEAENAAVRHFLIPYALNHPTDWERRAIADVVAMVRARAVKEPVPA